MKKTSTEFRLLFAHKMPFLILTLVRFSKVMLYPYSVTLGLKEFCSQFCVFLKKVLHFECRFYILFPVWEQLYLNVLGMFHKRQFFHEHSRINNSQ